MAALTGGYETYTSTGIREDLSDVIYNIDPIETPFMSSIGRGTCQAVAHEWQTDTLDTVAQNAVQESNESGFATPDPTERPQNECQISEKTIAVSGTHEAVTSAGFKSVLAYQLARKSKSLKRDMEFTLTQEQERDVGTATTNVRLMAGYETWIRDEQSSLGAGGADSAMTAGTPDDGSQRTDGTQRALLESQLKDVIQKVWTAGGNPTLLICGPFNKSVISSFSGNSTRFDQGEDRKLVAAIDVYCSDFGDHRVVPDRFSRDRTVMVVTPSLWSVDYLRPFKQSPIAKTGDSEKRLMNVEYTLRSSNKSGSGGVFDLTTS